MMMLGRRRILIRFVLRLTLFRFSFSLSRLHLESKAAISRYHTLTHSLTRTLSLTRQHMITCR